MLSRSGQGPPAADPPTPTHTLTRKGVGRGVVACPSPVGERRQAVAVEVEEDEAAQAAERVGHRPQLIGAAPPLSGQIPVPSAGALASPLQIGRGKTQHGPSKIPDAKKTTKPQKKKTQKKHENFAKIEKF